jgi:HK97 family phage major capsid protein
MTKRELLASVSALETEYSALLAASAAATDPVAHLASVDAKEAEIKTVKQQLAAVEALENRAKANASRSGAQVHDNAEDKPWRSFGEFLTGVISAEHAKLSGKPIDPRLHQLASGNNESVGSEGGFLVGTDIAPGFIERVFAAGVLSSKADAITISSGANGTKINGVDENSRANGSRYGGIRAYWGGEAQELTASTPKFRQVELQLRKLHALCYLTEEQMQDSTQVQSHIERNAPNEIAFALDEAIWNGNGAGIPIGILPSAAKISVAKESGQAAATIVAANITKMVSRMTPGSFVRSEWFMNMECWAQLPLITVGQQPVFVPPGVFSAAPFGTLMGRPINVIEHASALGTQGDIALIDMGEYALARKGSVNMQTSMHVRFLFDETAFKFTMRVDGKPKWTAPLTPYKGSTQSPFVFLDTRA